MKLLFTRRAIVSTRHLSLWSRCLVALIALAFVVGCGAQPAEQAPSLGHAAPAAAGVVDLANDDVAFLTQLFLTKGHLRVGVQLYRQSAFDMADVHMKHPHDELYAELAPAFTARGLPGFAEELTGLADSVEGRQPLDRVEAAYATVAAAIDRAAGIDAGLGREAGEVVRVVANLIRHAADEYAVGVQGDRVVEPQEYQDAWGFTQMAIEQIDRLAARGDVAGRATGDIRARLESLAPAWPSVVPPDTITSGASSLAAAAAHIESAASGS